MDETEQKAAWSSEIKALIQALRKIVKSREGDFLTLGTSVQGLFRRAGALSDDARKLAELMSVGEGNSVCCDLGEISTNLNATCRVEDSEAIMEELERKKAFIASLQNMLGDFRRIVRTLQVLGISTRIESARLGDTGRGFMTLADDVETLAGSIHEHVTMIMDHSVSLLKLVESAASSTAIIIESRRECGARMFQSISDNLASMTLINEQSRAMSQTTVETASRVRQSIGEVVSSLQFHDITRQQIEHVEEVLTEVLNVLQGRDDPETHGQLEGWLADVFELQASQTGLAGQELYEAVGRLKSHLLNIATEIGILSEGIGRIVSADTQGESTLDKIGRQVGKVIETAMHNSEQSSAIQDIMGRVAGTVSSMVEFVDDIEDVGSEIELIALNASVKAARTGDEGKALGVLAISIQRLSSDAREHTGKVANLLRNLAEASELLRTNAEVAANTGENEELISRLKNLIETLRRVNLNTSAMFGSINQEARELASEIRSVSGGITFQEAIRNEAEAVRNRILNIVRTARTIAPVGNDKDRPARLKELFSRYTMESERIVHQNVFGFGEGHHPGASASAGSSDDSEYGDNVELF